jgi:hypothetical protein
VRFLCLLIAEPDVAVPAPGTAEFDAIMAEFQASTAAMRASGVLVDSGPLQSSAAATTLRVRDGETLLSPGPFAAAGERVGGYYVLDCADLGEAVRWAATIPSARYGAVEVRPLMALPGHE